MTDWVEAQPTGVSRGVPAGAENRRERGGCRSAKAAAGPGRWATGKYPADCHRVTVECYHSGPKVSEKELAGGTKDIPVQLNGKLKFCVTVSTEISDKEMLDIIKNDERVIKLHENNNVVKDIYVPGRIYNIVVK